jgi:hypothetical protein
MTMLSMGQSRAAPGKPFRVWPSERVSSAGAQQPVP